MITTDTGKMTIVKLQSALKKKEISVVEVVEAFYKRIEKVDNQIKAWVRLSKETALVQARNLDNSYEHFDRLPLYGIPFGVKDIIYTENVKTSAGSKVNEDFTPSYDATVVQKLKNAGAIVLGKTTTTEYANLGGPPPTCNPWNLEHTPGGSSSGSAAAMAGETAMFTLGTQTAGSLSRPASFNNLTVLKGTFGLVSRHGVIPASWSLDHVGAFTHTVEDTCLVYNEMLGFDSKDPASLENGIDKLTCQSANLLNQMTVAVPEDYFFDEIDMNVQAVFEETVKVFKEMGATIISYKMPANLKEAIQAHELVMKTEVASYHEEMFRKKGCLYTDSLQQLIRSGLSVPARDYLRAQRIRAEYRESLIAGLAEFDALITPAAPTPAPHGILATGSPRFNGLFTNAGVPTLTLPAGFSEGLPVGVQLVGNVLTEQKLIDLGHSFQLETDFHLRKPFL